MAGSSEQNDEAVELIPGLEVSRWMLIDQHLQQLSVIGNNLQGSSFLLCAVSVLSAPASLSPLSSGSC